MAKSTNGASPNFRVIGTRPIRPDGFDKVTGAAKFGADYYFPGMLHGKVLRSPHAHALIKAIRFDKALALPGVKAVITGADFPEAEDAQVQIGELMGNPRQLSFNLMARDKALYDGHAVAAVAATSPHIADEALKLIEVDYELLPPVLTVDEAMKPGAPILLPELRSQLLADRNSPGQPDGPPEPTNVASHGLLKRGDIEAGFEQADVIVEHTYRTATVHQGYIEPQNALALYNPDGHVTVYCSSQGQFQVRLLTSLVLKLPVGAIRVIPAEIGGGFGGKTTIYLEPLAVMLAKKTARPVKMVMNRAEVLRATGPSSGTKIDVKMGATRDGRITAAKIWMAYEAGAFPGSPFMAGAMTTTASYNIPNLLIDTFDVVVNKPKVAAYRAPGAPHSAFACESIIDELAEKCGIDPLDMRILNGSHEGTPQPAGPPFKRIGLIECCEALRDSAHYRSELIGLNRGRGVATGFWFNGGAQSSAAVNFHTDGTLSVVTGSVDIGGSRAAMGMIAAEVLGLEVNDVRSIVADTDSIGHTDVTGGSRVTVATGLAVYNAAQDVVQQLKQRAALVWERKPEDVEFNLGTFKLRGNGVPPLTLKQLASRLSRTGGPITGRASLNAGAVGAVGNAFAATCVDLEVDPDTGKVQILRCTIAQDVGRALHPSYVEGQMQGGTVQGLGWALNEEYVYDRNGVMRNTGLLDYRMPTCLDLPMIDTILVEVANPGHPLGIRGVGEVSIVPVLAAVANAIYRATGVRIRELPISPPRLLKAILASDESQSAAADATAGSAVNP
ncbi:MAG TPA: xanthine dehydrogenase family protein molybdopterin-binding subunit [Candidatus Binataceae bacterium]|nr:xanthine dehydrogenase family protein molybdopterin-binding subunit [Candidatus Binataceae bacterium]